jgi:hypothetical protein
MRLSYGAEETLRARERDADGNGPLHVAREGANDQIRHTRRRKSGRIASRMPSEDVRNMVTRSMTKEGHGKHASKRGRK